MKLATWKAPGRAAPVAGQVVDGRAVAFADGSSVVDVLAGSGSAATGSDSWALDEVELLAPIPSPGTVYAIGLNYAKHVEETGNKPPSQPIVFVKVAGSVAPAWRADRAPRSRPAARLRGRADDRDRGRREDRRVVRRRRCQRA